MNKFVGFILVLALSSCTKSGGGDSADEVAIVDDQPKLVMDEAAAGDEAGEIISTAENRNNLDGEVLIQDQTLALTIGLDPNAEELSKQPENAKVTYYDLESLNGVELGETETDLDGEASITLDLPKYYVIRVEYQDFGTVKALVAPEMIEGSQQGDEMDIRLNRKTTITTDIFEELLKDSAMLAKAHSLEIPYDTLQKAADGLYGKVSKTIAKSQKGDYFRSEDYQQVLSSYSQFLIKSLFSLNDYDESFANDRIQEALAELSMTSPTVDLSFELKDEEPTSCIIKQEVCVKRPTRVGEFRDNYQGAGSDYDRCLRRAHEYHRWCGNSADDVTTAEFKQNGDTLVTMSSASPFSGCFIKQDQCQRDPKRVGQFIDNHKQASSDVDRCMMRAHDMHKWCKNSSDSITLASFYHKGVLQKQIDSRMPYTGCFIQLDICQKKPERVGYFIDNHQNASTDVDRCMMRAHDFHRWCRNDFDDRTVASFYDKGNLVQELDSQTAYTGCFIEQDTCFAHPEKEGLFIDNHKTAHTDQDQCLARAHFYHAWCKNGADGVTTSSFYDKGKILAQSSSQVPYTGCFIQQDTCTKHPERVGLFVDNYQNASSDPDRCMMRAHDFHRWCKNDKESVTIASFFDRGTLIKRNDSETPYTGCFVKLDVCQKRPEREGLIYDNHQNASHDQDRCLMRAHDYHRWCGNKTDQIVSASFYEKGSVLATINSDIPYTGCFIRQDQCQRNPDRVGLFSDNYKNSSFDQTRCMERASDFHNWCRNSDGEASAAEFYQAGTLIQKTVVN
ncbi:hypothetical protein [Pseudobacteriovorax antillogorgiicola]|nr:hypothetical protein [Pseudobacteriovorax antillogorgiicola]